MMTESSWSSSRFSSTVRSVSAMRMSRRSTTLCTWSTDVRTFVRRVATPDTRGEVLRGEHVPAGARERLSEDFAGRSDSIAGFAADGPVQVVVHVLLRLAAPRAKRLLKPHSASNAGLSARLVLNWTNVQFLAQGGPIGVSGTQYRPTVYCARRGETGVADGLVTVGPEANPFEPRP